MKDTVEKKCIMVFGMKEETQPIRHLREKGKVIWRTSGEGNARQGEEHGRGDRRNN